MTKQPLDLITQWEAQARLHCPKGDVGMTEEMQPWAIIQSLISMHQNQSQKIDKLQATLDEVEDCLLSVAHGNRMEIVCLAIDCLLKRK